jgi:hypothetical protein
MSNAYTVLGVPVAADRGEIRAAYIDLARRLHPDRNAGSVQAVQRLRDVNQAYALSRIQNGDRPMTSSCSNRRSGRGSSANARRPSWWQALR